MNSKRDIIIARVHKYTQLPVVFRAPIVKEKYKLINNHKLGHDLEQNMTFEHQKALFDPPTAL